jgi:hypothetical protein
MQITYIEKERDKYVYILTKMFDISIFIIQPLLHKKFVDKKSNILRKKEVSTDHRCLHIVLLFEIIFM